MNIENLIGILTSPDRIDILQGMLDNGQMVQHLPEIACLSGVTQGKQHTSDVFGHTLDVLANTPLDIVGSLGALFHDCGKPATRKVCENTGKISFIGHAAVGATIATKVLTRLDRDGFFSHSISDVAKIIHNHMDTKGFGATGSLATDRALRRLAQRLGTTETLCIFLDVVHADNISHSVEFAMPLQVPGLFRRMNDLGIL